MMKITVIGTGYVGLVTGACLAQVGNEVVCLDIDKDKIQLLQDGGIPIHEPGLDVLILTNKKAGRLSFTTNIELATQHGNVQFIAVDTPPSKDGSADLTHTLHAARNIGRHITRPTVVVNKSTVPVGTAEKVSEAINDELKNRQLSIPVSVVSNPEFLKEGSAIQDFMRGSRIIIGSSDFDAINIMKTVYAPINRNHEKIIIMSARSAELTKYAANAMLATRISFMNELANLAEHLGVDIEAVRQGIGSDPRIGYQFLYPGCGFGGSCFPKDIKALIATAINTIGQPLKILEAVDAINEKQKLILFDKIQTYFNRNLKGRRFAVWGLAFKPNTDDIRNAPSITIIEALLNEGAAVMAYDPIAAGQARKHFNGIQNITISDDGYEVLDKADSLVIATECTEFRSPDFAKLKDSLTKPIIFDGRNLYSPEHMKELGFTYFSIGRPFPVKEPV